MASRFPTLTAAARAGLACASALWLGACAAPPQAPQVDVPTAPIGETVSVFYPAGSCVTGVIEVQVWDRDGAAWVAHPEHPRVEAGTCQTERSDQLLNEFRVRCIDPDGVKSPSEWVEGAATDETVGEAAPACPDALKDTPAA